MRSLTAALTALSMLACALVLAGCGPEASGGEVRVVQEYARALPVALAANDLAPVEAVATPEQADRVRMYVLSILGEGQRLDASLMQQEVLSTGGEGPESATVVAEETWELRYADLETGELVSSETHHAEVTYTLVLTETGWRVSDINETVIE